MDKIYVLFTGEYSDKEVQGFVETEEEAERMCEYNNATSDLHSWREWHYEEVEKIKKNVPDVKPVYIITIKFIEFSPFGWKRKETAFLCGCYLPDAEEVKNARYCEITPADGDKRYTEAVVDVVLREPDSSKAWKIAQDRLYKKLAEQELDGMQLP